MDDPRVAFPVFEKAQELGVNLVGVHKGVPLGPQPIEATQTWDMIWHPRWALEAFWNFEIPQDLVDGYGYPQLTEQAKRKILGENLARLHGIDVEAKKKELGVPS